MKTVRELFGEKIRALRKAKGWTQEELGEKSGVHYTYVGQVERAETNLSLDNIERLSNGLGVTPAELFAFSSSRSAVSQKQRLVLELTALLEEQSVKELERVKRILKEVLEG